MLIVTTVFATSLTAEAASVSATLSKTSYTYDGKVKTPSVTVKNGNGKTLKKNTDYTVTYPKGRKAVGTYTVKVTFKGNYSGTVKKTFTIKPKATTLSSVSAKTKGFTVKWKKQTTQTTGYQIQYSTSSKFTSGTSKSVTVNKNSTTSKSITGLKAKKKYYVRIRTYKAVNGKKICSAWSKAKSVTTKASTTSSNSGTKKGSTVYITPTGKKYHYSKACAGKNAKATSLSDARKSYDPCKKCAQ